MHFQTHFRDKSVLQSCWFAPFFLKHSWNFQITVPFYILFWFPGSFPFPYDNHFSVEVSQTLVGSIVCPFLSSLIVFAHLWLHWSYALEGFISKHLLPLPNEMVSEGAPYCSNNMLAMLSALSSGMRGVWALATSKAELWQKANNFL